MNRLERRIQNKRERHWHAFRPRRPRPVPLRAVASLLAVAMGLLGCPPAGHQGQAHPGRVEFQEPARVRVAQGFVNAIGGNLSIERTDISSDTHLGPFDLGAVYNSATGRWLWSFETSLVGSVFVDESGAEHTVGGVKDGDPVFGTRWLRHGPGAMRTKAGLVYVFDAGGRLRWIQMSRAPYPRLIFLGEVIAGTKRTTRISQCLAESIPCQRLYDVAYDADGRIVALEDPRTGRTARFTWEGERLVNARSPMEVAEGRPGRTYTYDLLGRITSLTTGDGERVEYGWDGVRVREVRRVGAGDPADVFFYEDEVDGLYTTRHWDPLGVERVYVYDGQDRLQRVTNSANGLTTAWSWAATPSRPVSRTEPTGETTGYEWKRDDLVTKIEPSGNVVRYTYHPDALSFDGWTLDGWPRERPSHRAYLRVEDSVGLVEANRYDDQGRRLSTTNGAGETTRFEYQNRSGSAICSNAVCVVVEPDGTITELSYFDSGHPGTIAGRAPSFGLGDQRRDYDAVGNLVAGSPVHMAGPGGIVSREYDADRNLRALNLADGGRIAFEVRSDGRRTAIRRPDGDDHEMDYDVLGRMTARRERVDGAWQETLFEYDLADRWTRLVRPNGMEQRVEYDADGRVAALRSYRSGALESESLARWEGERLTQRQDSASGIAYYGYDAAGRMTTQQHADGTFTEWTYDLRGRKRSESYLTENLALLRTLGYEYDLADRETEIRDGVAPLLRRRIEGGRLVAVEYGNGLTRAYEYDAFGAYLGMRTTDPDGNLVEETTHAGSVDVTGAPPSVPAIVHQDVTTTLYGDDVWQSAEEVELVPTAVTHLFGSRVSRQGQTSFTFDGRSNLLARGGTVFGFNAEGNRLLTAATPGETALAFSYDEAGYTTTRGSRAITWTALGRMSSHGDDTLEWDAVGNLMAATVNGVRSEWRWGGAVSADEQGGLRIARDEFVIDVGSNSHLYRHRDYRGNVKFTSDDLGTIRAGYHYAPFGLDSTWGSDEDLSRFAGRNGFGELMILGARVYDPATGRFLSQDPIFDDVNQYAYTLGNPLWWWDPDGAHAENANAEAVSKATGVAGSLMVVIATCIGGGPILMGFGAILLAIAAIAYVFTRIDPVRVRWRRALYPIEGYDARRLHLHCPQPRRRVWNWA